MKAKQSLDLSLRKDLRCLVHAGLDEYRACIWTSLGEFRYDRYESVYVTLMTV